MTLTRTADGEVLHPSGATRPLAVVLALPQREQRPPETVETEPSGSAASADPPTVTRLVAPHPDEDEAVHALGFITGLLDDLRSTLTRRQQQTASGELSDLLLDAARDVVSEDPACTVLDLPGRTAAAALRVIVQRGLIRDEWDT